jgi:hypothetical protein
MADPKGGQHMSDDAPLSSCDASEKISNGAKEPHVASADNRAKWFRAFIRQIFF